MRKKTKGNKWERIPENASIFKIAVKFYKSNITTYFINQKFVLQIIT